MLDLVGDLARQTYPADRFEVVILDDGGTDGMADALTACTDLPYRLTVLRSPREGDYLSGRRWNQCIAAAAEPDVLIQVDDVRLRSDFVARHCAWHTGSLTVVTGAKFEGDDETWELASCQRANLAGPGGCGARGHLDGGVGSQHELPPGSGGRHVVRAVRAPVRRANGRVGVS